MKKIILAILFCLIVFVAYFVLSNLTFKSDLKNRIKGIDISNSYKGELNWNALRENKGFVILRAVREVDTCKTVGVLYGRRATYHSFPNTYHLQIFFLNSFLSILYHTQQY
jgi:hypothetical protein